MDDFLAKLQKIRSGFLGRMRMIFILDLIAVFSILYAILIIINIGYFLNKTPIPSYVPVNFAAPLLGLLIALIISTLLHRKDKKSNVIGLIEKKYPDLDEKLRTAYDNRDETNIIVDSLKSAVSNAMDHVSSAHLLAKGMIISKVVLTIIFIAGMVFISNNPAYQIPEDALDNVTKAFANDQNNTVLTDTTGRLENVDNIGAKGSGDIFGKPRIASIEGKDVDLTLHTGVETGFIVKESTAAASQFIKSASFPVDVLGSNVSDGGYNMLMKKTETEKQLINKYAVERSKI